MVFTHATRVRVPDGEKFSFFFCAVASSKQKVICAGRESNPGLVRGRDVYYHCTTGAVSSLSIPRLELGTSRVLGERHDQLDHTDERIGESTGVSGFRSQYLVLAKDARFRLRQYPCLVSNGVSGFRSQYLVLAKHARFRLRQYPEELRHGESNPGHLRDRQRCYQLHHDG